MYNEKLVNKIVLFILGYGSKFKDEINEYNDRLKPKIIESKYDKDKSLIKYRKYADRGISLYMLMHSNRHIIEAEEKEEIAQRLEAYYYKEITKQIEIEKV